MTAAWKTGDRVRIAIGDDQVIGTVKLASPNGWSLMLAFDAILHGHVGMMPVLRDVGGEFRSIITGQTVSLSAV
jgi:hypothetical protein